MGKIMFFLENQMQSREGWIAPRDVKVNNNPTYHQLLKL